MPYHLLIIPYILIPLVCYLKKWHTVLILWIIQGMFLDIFAVHLMGYLSALKITGFVLLPFMLFNIKEVLSTRAGKLVLFQPLWLILTFILFGLIFPWENTTNFTRMNGSYIRALKQILNHITEFSLILYLAHVLRDSKRLQWAMRGLLICAAVCTVGIYLEKYTGFDYFRFFTNGKPLQIASRMRGFTFEPRAASQYMAYFALLLMSTSGINLIYKLLLIPVILGAFLFAQAMTGFVMMAAGGVVMLAGMAFIKHKNLKQNLIILAMIFVMISGFFLTPYAKEAKSYLTNRVFIFTSEKFAYRFEYADGAAVAFLMDKPAYLLAGVGTGQSSFASSPYVAEDLKPFYPDGIDYVPLMGIILGLMNGGLIFIGAQLAFIFIGIKALYRRVKKTSDDLSKDAFSYTLIIVSLYYLQVRYIHVFAMAVMLMAVLDEKNSAES